MSTEETFEGRPAIVVASGPAVAGLWQALDSQRALVALTQAAMERNVDVVTVADPDTASLLAQAAMPHASPHGGERYRYSGRVHAVETGGFDQAACAVLAPYSLMGGLAYYDAEMQWQVLSDRDVTESAEPPGARHPLRLNLVSMAPRTLGAVLVAPTYGQMDSVVTWSTSFPVCVLCADNEVANEVAPFDRTEELAERLGLRFPDVPPDELLEGGRSWPYGIMMELLLEDWLEGAGPSSRR